MSTYALLNGLCVLALLSCFSFSAVGTLSAVVDNRFGVNSQGLALPELEAIGNARLNWFLLPALAYALAVVTNLGTGLIEKEGYLFRTGWSVILYGFLALEVVSGIAMVSASRRRDDWRLLSTWRRLASEVNRWEEDEVAVSHARLNAAERQCQRLDENPNRTTKLNTKAGKLVGVPDLDWRERPTVGLFIIQSSGQRVGTPARSLMRWLWFSRVARLFVTLWTLSVACIGVIAVIGHPLSAPVFAWTGAAALAAALLGLAFARGNLIFHARLDARDRALRNDVIAAIRKYQHQDSNQVVRKAKVHKWLARCRRRRSSSPVP